MCNIHKKTYFTTKTIYKAVKKMQGRYFSFYSGFEIKLGPVDPEWSLSKLDSSIKCKWRASTWMGVRPYLPSMTLYNPDIVGKVTGFGKEKWAKLVFNKPRFQKPDVEFAILKMVLGGDIMKGDATGVAKFIPDKIVTWAGSEILSFEEIYSAPSLINLRNREVSKPADIIPI